MNIRTNKEFQTLLAERIKYYRINMNMTQKDLEEKSGVSSRTISRLEQGESIQMESFIKILIALKIADNLELLIPDQTKRPSYYLNDANKKNRRCRKINLAREYYEWMEDKNEHNS